MSDEVPEGWSSTRISNLVTEVTVRVDPKTIADLNTPYLGLEDIGQGTGTVVSVGRASSATSQKSGFIAGDTLFGKLRPNLKKVARPDFDGICSTDIAVFRAKPGVDPEFAFKVLSSEPVIAHAVAQAAGTKMPRAHARSVLNFDTILPPLDEQRRIAGVLRSMDEAIAKEFAVLGQLRISYDSTMSAFLTSGNRSDDGVSPDQWTTGRVKAVHKIPSEWRLTRLVEVAKLESGHTPSRSVQAYWQDGDIGWISLHDTKNLERIEIQETALKITAAGVANSSARMLPRGTVCLSRTATVGKCVIMGKSMTTSQDFANFVCSPVLNNRYLLHLFRWMGPIWKALSSGSTHKTIYMPTFEALQIVLPPIGAQESVATVLDAIAASIEHSSEHLEFLRALRRSISSDLLSGRTRVPA